MKIGNEYADAIGHMYDQIPKAVLAAVAVSALTSGGQYIASARDVVLREWWTLYYNGIVKQRPPGKGP